MNTPPSVIVFDVNETLSDMSPLQTRFGDVGAPEYLARVWFAALLRDGFALAAAGGSAKFALIAADVLRDVLRDVALTRSLDYAVTHVMDGFAGLNLHVDIAEGIRALRDAGFRLVTLSNGSAHVAETLLTRAEIRTDFDVLLTVEDAPAWKPVRSAYSLDDMALDVVGLLDALAVPRVHVVGVSMGGMIGQLLAADHPSRVASFTCIMSSSGARGLPQPSTATRMVLLSRPTSQEPQAIIDHYVKVLKVIGSKQFAASDEQIRERIKESLAPYYFPLGTARQLMAITANGDRSRKLGKISCPVKIIHGSTDPLIPLPAAHDLHEKIRGSSLEVIEGMAHDMPPALLPQLSSLILENAQRTPVAA